MEAEPNETLYAHNINEKINKDVLKKQLYMLFSQYGRVKQIIACKGLKLRGQVIYSFIHS
jgi:RNA recognition motif-containing protein